ncbi:MAG: ATP-binding cassette domain-containing protein [Betaproteobacteria bacterium]|nr:ATP-binding cassette domain-containing protein [Betaproteobacteria bacterium]
MRYALYTLCAFLAALVIALPYLGLLPAWTPALATVTAFMALSLIGLNLIFGVTGMLALGQAAFVALPGYAAGILQQSAGVPGPLAILLGIVIAVAIARLIAEIFVRLPGIYLAIGTLGFAFVVEGVARAFPSITGGASGLVLEFPFAMTRNSWYGLAIASLIAGLFSFALLVRGSFLRTLRLVRHDELAAQVLGVNVARVKANVFTIGSTYSAVGGVLLAYYVGVLSPESGGVNASLEALAMVIIGGAGALLGPVAGAAGVQWLFAVAGGAAHYELLVYGLGFFLVVLFAPAGLMGLFKRGLFKGGLFKRGFIKQGSSNRGWFKSRALVTPAPGAAAIAGAAQPGREGVCLQVEGVARHFGGLLAVDDVSFEVRFGQIVALIGPNGAGKSTLFNCVSGIEPLTRGRVILEGVDVGGAPIHRRAGGIGRSFQVPRLVPDMTALENVVARLDHLPLSRRQGARAQLAAFGLEDFAERVVREIGLGFHKLIELARASAGDPPLLLLDEPAVGLTGDEVTRLAAALRRLRAGGAAILVVEHNIDFVATIADEVLVIESGKLIARGKPADVIADPKVQEAYFGALA